MDVARLDKWLIDYCRREYVEWIGRRYVQQHGNIRDGARLKAALNELVLLNRIQVLYDGKQIAIWINPALISNGK